MLISVLLVDDHAVVRDGVRHLLEVHPGIRVVGSFGDGREAIAFAENQDFDVAIIDVAMPGLNGIEVARQIHDACPAAHILMLSMHSSHEHVYQAFEAGAQGYLLKESAGNEVIEAVRAVHSGRRFVSRKIAGNALDIYLGERRRKGSPLLQLSARERQVLQLIVEGKTSAEVGAVLNLSPKSVDTYRSRMMKKLEIGDLPGLVKFSIRHGLTTID
jgi:DNA-binding NarL/FixJ family response regulator